MSAVAEKLTRSAFRKRYADQKPNWELIDGIPEQKALGSKRHSYLQGILCAMLDELGFRAGTELTLEISETWEPIPDVAGMLGPESDDVYQSQPPAVVIEILSPSDRAPNLLEKLVRYAQWGIVDILLFDPAKEQAWWFWGGERLGLTLIEGSYRFRSMPGAEMAPAEAFRRLRLKIGGE